MVARNEIANDRTKTKGVCVRWHTQYCCRCGNNETDQRRVQLRFHDCRLQPDDRSRNKDRRDSNMPSLDERVIFWTIDSFPAPCCHNVEHIAPPFPIHHKIAPTIDGRKATKIKSVRRSTRPSLKSTGISVGEIIPSSASEVSCQSASDRDPGSASKRAPPFYVLSD